MSENSLKLMHPIEFAKETIDFLEFKEVTAADMRTVKADMSMGDLIDIGGRLCGRPKSFMNQLKAEDVNRLCEYVGNALTGGL